MILMASMGVLSSRRMVTFMGGCASLILSLTTRLILALPGQEAQDLRDVVALKFIERMPPVRWRPQGAGSGDGGRARYPASVPLARLVAGNRSRRKSGRHARDGGPLTGGSMGAGASGRARGRGRRRARSRHRGTGFGRIGDGGRNNCGAPAPPPAGGGWATATETVRIAAEIRMKQILRIG